MGRGMVWYVHLQSGERAQHFEAIKLALLPVNDPASIILWTLQTTADKRCGQMQTVRNNAEKCKQTAENADKLRTCGNEKASI